MKFTEISVEIGETRNHPFEYGNKRCSVRMTAVIEDTDQQDHRTITDILRELADEHVTEELDAWEDGLMEEKRIEAVQGSIRGRLDQLRHGASTMDQVKGKRDDILALLSELPEDMRMPWIEKLEEVGVEAIKRIEAIPPQEDLDDDAVIEVDELGW